MISLKTTVLSARAPDETGRRLIPDSKQRRPFLEIIQRPPGLLACLRASGDADALEPGGGRRFTDKEKMDKSNAIGDIETAVAIVVQEEL